MICFIKNIIAIIYLGIVRTYFLKRCMLTKNNLLFINTEKLGDIVISSDILEYYNTFEKYDEVYFLVSEQYSDLFSNYSGKFKIISFNKSKFKNSISYNIKFVKFINNLCIKEVYNISQARGFINELLTHVNLSAITYSTNNNSEYLGRSFLNYWNGKYKKILFKNISNEYEKISNLIALFQNRIDDENRKSFFPTMPSSYSEMDFISISPYSSENIKNWSVERFRKLILAFNTKIRFIVLCSVAQKKQALKEFGDLQNVVISDASLSNVVGIIKDSILFIGNDSGLTHLAAKLGIQTIGIIGGGMYSRYYPIPNCENIYYFINRLDCFDCNWVCKFETPLCLNEISEYKIIKLISSIINK